ncbi:hypothetical protein [Rhodococcus qingshengii]|uniref:hypothetical protein n=1 Tax=Rhodococcus qingshengii TaxID=334542 RepID=UPI002941E602|nr:hypothetical protein [Rhodococcus qingshengii]WOI86010.1 hypothetical protein R0122_22790 [Rhodococcus qingshengii]
MTPQSKPRKRGRRPERSAGAVERRLPDPYEGIDHIVRASAEQAMREELALQRFEHAALQTMHEQRLHSAFTESVIDEAIQVTTKAKALANDNPLLEAVAAPLLQTYLARAQERIDHFGRY